MNVDGNVTSTSAAETQSPEAEACEFVAQDQEPPKPPTASEIGCEEPKRPRTYEELPETEKDSVKRTSTKKIMTVLRDFRQDREAAERKYRGLDADEAVPILMEELRRRGIPT